MNKHQKTALKLFIKGIFYFDQDYINNIWNLQSLASATNTNAQDIHKFVNHQINNLQIKFGHQIKRYHLPKILVHLNLIAQRHRINRQLKRNLPPKTKTDTFKFVEYWSKQNVTVSKINSYSKIRKLFNARSLDLTNNNYTQHRLSNYVEYLTKDSKDVILLMFPVTKD